MARVRGGARKGARKAVSSGTAATTSRDKSSAILREAKSVRDVDLRASKASSAGESSHSNVAGFAGVHTDDAVPARALSFLPLRKPTTALEVLFWHECASASHLSLALRKCDVDWRAVLDAKEWCAEPVAAHEDAMLSRASAALVSSCDVEQRLRVALHSLVDVCALLVHFYDDRVCVASCDDDAARTDGVFASTAQCLDNRPNSNVCASGMPDSADVRAAVACAGVVDCDRRSLRERCAHALSTLHGAHHGHLCWVRPQHVDVVVALVQLCEAAVPPRGPSLLASSSLLSRSFASSSPLRTCTAPSVADAHVGGTRIDQRSPVNETSVATADATASAQVTPRRGWHSLHAAEAVQCLWQRADGSSQSCALVPSPVLFAPVYERLVSLCRLWQLRCAYTTLMPRLRVCTEAHDVAQVLCLVPETTSTSHTTTNATAAPAAGDLDVHARTCASRLAPLPSSLDLCHRREAHILRALLQQCNADCALDVDAWGVSATCGGMHCNGDGCVCAAHTRTRHARIDAPRTAASPAPSRCPLVLCGGVYVVHTDARARAMHTLLRESALYGLPPFLRSIRRAAHELAGHASAPVPDVLHGQHVGASAVALPGRSHDIAGYVDANATRAMSTTTMATASVAARRMAYARERSASATRVYAHALFLAPDSLDASVFAVPDAVQAPLVHEELIELTVQHCCVGMVVGEADQIVQLLMQHHTRATRNGDRVSEATACDALLRYVLHARAHARRLRHAAHDRRGGGDGGVGVDDTAQPPCVVQWLCDNRWCADTHYFGLVYVVVDDCNDLDGCDDAAPRAMLHQTQQAHDDVDGAAACMSASSALREPAYYVACVVRLSRHGPSAP